MKVCNIVHEVVIKTIQKIKKCKRVFEEALQIAEKAKEKRKDIPILMQSSKEQHGEIRKASSATNAKK